MAAIPEATNMTLSLDDVKTTSNTSTPAVTANPSKNVSSGTYQDGTTRLLSIMPTIGRPRKRTRTGRKARLETSSLAKCRDRGDERGQQPGVPSPATVHPASFDWQYLIVSTTNYQARPARPCLISGSSTDWPSVPQSNPDLQATAMNLPLASDGTTWYEDRSSEIRLTAWGELQQSTAQGPRRSTAPSHIGQMLLEHSSHDVRQEHMMLGMT